MALQKERTVEKALDSITELRRETSEHVAAYEPGSGTVDLIEKESATEHRAVTVNGRHKSADRMAGAGLEAEKILDGEVLHGDHVVVDADKKTGKMVFEVSKRVGEKEPAKARG